MEKNQDRTLLLVKRCLQAALVAGVCFLAYLYATSTQQPERTPPMPDPQEASAPPPAPGPPPAEKAASTFESTWGFQVIGLMLTNNNTAVEVRYTVTDPEKIGLLNETNFAAYLVSQESGAKLPMITPPTQASSGQGASLRTTRRMARLAGRFPPPPSRTVTGGTYAVEIPNWGMALQTGSRVSLIVGEVRQDGLIVE